MNMGRGFQPLKWPGTIDTYLRIFLITPTVGRNLKLFSLVLALVGKRL